MNVSPAPRCTPNCVMFAVLLASNLLASLNQSMMNIALDAVATTFHVELALANWLVLGFSIVAGATITTAAAVLKRIGLRKVMAVGYALSLAGGLLGLFSWDFPSMVAARVLQAFTVGLFFPVVSAAILAIAPKGRSATLLSLNSAVIGAGLAFVPVLSGLFITYVNLRAVFLVPTVLSAVLLVVGPLTLHDIEQRGHRRIDAPSVVLSFIGLTAFMSGLNTVGKDPLPSVGLMLAGAVVIGLFTWRQRRLDEPLLDLTPLKNHAFTVGEIISMLGFAGSLYLSLLVPLYLEGTAGCSAFTAGALLAAPILAYAATTFLGGRIEDARGIWPLVPTGFALIVAGLAGLWVASSHLVTVGVLVCAGVTYAGVGLVFAPLKSRDLSAVPKELTSNASAIHSTLAQVITSLASALFVGVMSSDVSALLARGASKADAYAAGFSHTLLIELGIAVAAGIASVAFARMMHRRWVAARKGEA